MEQTQTQHTVSERRHTHGMNMTDSVCIIRQTERIDVTYTHSRDKHAE